ncbi:sensor histidine kinase [Tahibacter caeni]|uniref:sensor histidine kinase n=1 Tax=Tahibacter caeni TaxID=1453545 RepID=UPI002147D410|nr:HAMP domain-containing sensor histidine kinase [Tahibacter caeni]
MLARLPLRRRVALAYGILGFCLSLMFAFATTYLTEDYEYIVLAEVLEGQAEEFAARLRADPQAALPRAGQLSGYLRRADGSGAVPSELAALAPGVYELHDGDRHAGVFDTDAGRLYFVIDIGPIEALERHLVGFMVAVVLLGTALSGWAGWMLAGRTIAPVKHLADAVDALPVRPLPTQLAGLVGGDELGRLARAIDAYQARLVAADAAERAFFADASHELRTPIAVVQGAAEVLLDDPAADAGQRRRLVRLERGVGELTDLIAVLLGLARRSVYHAERVDAAQLLADAAASWRAATDPGDLQLAIDADGTLCLPRAEALLVLRGLLRRLAPPPGAGRLALRAGDGWIALAFAAAGAEAATPTPVAASDSGAPPTLLGRFIAHLGWQVEQTVDGDGRHCRIRLPPAAGTPDA